jgi:polyamine oxidase
MNPQLRYKLHSPTPTANRDNMQSKMVTVLVLGAGPAGISAAKTLIESGITPIILEARERIGGRVCPGKLRKNLVAIRSPSNDADDTNNDEEELKIQLGANWIHGLDPEYNPIHTFVRELNLTLHENSSDDEPGDDVLLFDRDPLTGISSTVESEQFVAVMRRYNWIREELLEQNSSCELSVKDILLDLIAKSESGGLFGACSAVEKRILTWLMDRVSIDIASPLECVSIKSMLEGESDGEHGEAVIEEGYSRVFDYLVERFGMKVLHNHEVRSIIAAPESCDGVIVHCANDMQFQVDYCVCTLPLGVLVNVDRPIVFTPPLSNHLNSILSTVSSGLMNIVWLWYPHQFWPNDVNFIGISRGEAHTIAGCEFSTFLVPHVHNQAGVRQAVLMAQTFGQFADEIERMSDCDIAKKATTALTPLFGNIPDPIGCAHSAWNSDTFSRGSWSYFDRRTKGESVVPDGPPIHCDRIVFAGEYLSTENRGTVNGAYATGARAAEHIIQQLHRA